MKRIDHETLEMFAEESSVRLARIADDLELLAKSRSVNMEVIHSIFRDTHSLKGAANLLELRPVEQIANKLEDILDSIRSGLEEPDEQLIDILDASYARIEQMLKNPHVLQLIDANRDIEAIESHLLTRRASGRG